MLSGRLSLFEVPDVEALCRATIKRAGPPYLSPDDYEDLLAYLVSECWVASQRYDPTRGATFRTWAIGVARRRIVDWLRTRHGRYQRRPHPNSLDALEQVDWSGLSPRGRAILRTVAIPFSEGYSPGEIARELATSTSWVSNRLDELRAELEQLSR